MSQPGDDIDRLMAVMGAAFDPAYGEAWSRRQVEEALMMGHCCYALVAADGQSPGPGQPAAGFYLSRHGFEEEELLLLAVSPEYRRRGLATRLLELLVEGASTRGARRLLLEMRRGNAAEQLYVTFGFAQIGQRLNYYRTPSGERLDAVTFGKTMD